MRTGSEPGQMPTPWKMSPARCLSPFSTLAALGLLVCVLCGGCQPAATGQQRPLAVVVSGDTAGWIAPCGCAANQSGGLPRRGSFVGQLRLEADVILADVGGAPSGTSPYDRLKFEAILKGEVAMGLDAHNIGAAEAALGADSLRRLADRLGAPLVSANVFDAKGEPVAPPMRIVKTATSRVALVGVLSEQYATEEIHVTPPQQAILDALGQAAGRYDTVVVLAYLPEDELRQLAEMLPEADAVVGGPTGQPVTPVSLGPTLLTSATKQGRFLAHLNAPLPGSTAGWTARVVELSDRFSDDEQQTANLDRFHAALGERDFTPDQTSFAQPLQATLPPSFSVAGTESCRACHPEDCQLWDASQHARAWNSLKEKGSHVDPDCQRCHATGYGLPGGFVSVGASATRLGVGCESCHGPSQGHVDDPTVHTAHFARADDHCTGCHDRRNSPQFDYEEYWSEIRHGEPATVSKTTSEDLR